MACVDDERDISGVDQPKPHRQFGRRNQRTNVWLQLTVGPFPISGNQEKIALGLCPAVPRVAENNDIVGHRPIEHRSVDAVVGKQFQPLITVLSATEQSQYHRDGIGGYPRLTATFTSHHQPSHVITVDIR